MVTVWSCYSFFTSWNEYLYKGPSLKFKVVSLSFSRMASFGWKRKIGEKVSKLTSQQFEAEAADEKDVVENDEGNWLHAIKRRKEILLEGCAEKSKQLKDEGASLAENKRYGFRVFL